MTENNSTSEKQTYQFKAEVSRVMDIVINSLYTDREIYVRELISNAVDALEKMRHLNLIKANEESKELPLEITIELDEKAKKFIIADTGVGMTNEELLSDLGKIAHSGSMDFLEKLEDHLKKDVNLIGQFGIGFYSIFMVAHRVTVQTKSYDQDARGYEWISDGASGFTIAPKDDLDHGTRIMLELKDDASEFANEFTIKRIIKQYSNFVPFPIIIKGEKINTVQALWSKNKNEISDADYTEFYKYVTGAFDEPLDRLHFSTDAPLAMNVLLFTPKENIESFGYGKVESAVDLHCRKVLIQKQAQGILPQWLRFLKGVVDSEDLPLNISRETMQDSILIRKINKAITNRFLKYLTDKAKNDEEAFNLFWNTFKTFIKEGIISDLDHRNSLSHLLRYETSKTEPEKWISLKQYIDRMAADQNEIYYINGSNRDSILKSPYIEVFTERDIEVIFTYDPADDFVMNHLDSYEGKKLISADAEKLDLPSSSQSEQKEEEEIRSKNINEKLQEWVKTVLKDKVAEVRISKRLVDSPAILVNPDTQVTGAMKRMMQALNKDFTAISKLTLEFNPQHALFQLLDKLRNNDPVFAEIALEQILDQAAITAGFTIEFDPMVERVNKILHRALEELAPPTIIQP
ncbi:molecular chaperone HtpG [candidate division CSSED10-310 bacterium]|uniref:Chaperone protein HtpG n=1 Tax=candidate division CSSED10-310 bacterium TaxID=2855610 RepID=A0ABV6YSL5_UNCC1